MPLRVVVYLHGSGFVLINLYPQVKLLELLEVNLAENDHEQVMPHWQGIAFLFCMDCSMEMMIYCVF